jgi:hypothetical protein
MKSNIFHMLNKAHRSPFKVLDLPRVLPRMPDGLLVFRNRLRKGNYDI